MRTVIPAPPPVGLAVEGTDALFPVRRVFCVGRNYAAHAREMGHDPEREPPFFFTKPADALVPGGGHVPYPPATADLHHEVELVVAIGQGGADIPAAQALDYVYGYTVGIDLTRRDVQAAAKKLARPWRSNPPTACRPASSASMRPERSRPPRRVAASAGRTKWASCCTPPAPPRAPRSCR